MPLGGAVIIAPFIANKKGLLGREKILKKYSQFSEGPEKVTSCHCFVAPCYSEASDYAEWRD